MSALTEVVSIDTHHELSTDGEARQIVRLVDELGKLDDKIKKLETLKKEKRVELEGICIPLGLADVEGNTHEIEFRERTDTTVNPTALRKWLNERDKTEEYFDTVFKVQNEKVRHHLGSDILDELGTSVTKPFASMYIKKKNGK